ncbi:competence protein CoiA family protein [Fructilactobacillus fructivorans]|uniref:Competence protein CoiA n=2 Tax=Fructilactobacillus fructivorans TaxID=1614 RepID=A0AAE6TYF2_9LACO|nr:Competence CoiA family protein [Fructilactobacillus fructivorans]KRN39544.1 Competence CoiA family protein [Fructilactobacillus fructivorans]QFX92835.1 hypothetical protein LF543_04345 [Fructilactobacillus fructivorans]RDV65573.1 hypothetical protein DXU76_00065 [Fructilactobacillus fructivorans]
MLMAYENGRLVKASDALKTHHYRCCECGELLVLRKGINKIPHFAHQSNSKCNSNEGESYVHNLGKFRILHSLPNGTRVEVYLPMIKQRADVLYHHLAVEYQCSPITLKRLTERVSGYLSIGITSFWILGMKYYRKRLASPNVLKFLRYHKNTGFYLIYLDPLTSRYLLRYCICQSDGKYQYQDRTFTKWATMIAFFKSNRQKEQLHPNLIKVCQRIEYQVRHLDPNMMKLQEYCYYHHSSITGCPLICHHYRDLPPVFGKQWLKWVVMIICELKKWVGKRIRQFVSEVYQKLDFTDHFVFLVNVKELRVSYINGFLNDLIDRKLLVIEHGIIKQVSDFTWYRDVYAKINVIRECS